MRWIRRLAIYVGNSKPATLCMRRRRSRTASYFSEVGIAIFTRWTRRPVRRNGVFTAGEDPLIHNQVGFQSSPAVANGVGLYRLPRRELVRA